MNDIKGILNILKENRNRIAENISADVDYYSFLRGFDFVLDEINFILDIGENEDIEEIMLWIRKL